LNKFLPILSGTRKFSWHSDALWQDQILKQGSLVEMFPYQFACDHGQRICHKWSILALLKIQNYPQITSGKWSSLDY
jgi:hypothetical protein